MWPAREKVTTRSVYAMHAHVHAYTHHETGGEGSKVFIVFTSYVYFTWSHKTRIYSVKSVVIILQGMSLLLIRFKMQTLHGTSLIAIKCCLHIIGVHLNDLCVCLFLYRMPVRWSPSYSPTEPAQTSSGVDTPRSPWL